MEFRLEKCALLIMRRGKRQVKELNCQIKKALEPPKKRKITSTWEYLKQTSSNKPRC